MKKKIAVVIPARMAASRYPGKPLVNILGLPMIEHVRRRVMLSSIVSDVYVATCDQEIMDAVHGFVGKAIMTANTHERCTDRVEEAAKSIKADIIVVVQGDEPLFLPEIIEELVYPMLEDESIYCANLLSLIKKRDDLKDIDIVKATINRNFEIMYFSRSPVPYFRVDNNATCYRQTGISAFTKDFLSKFTNLRPTPLEIAESVDFLRILEHGYKIKAVISEREMFGVDREEDVAVIENILQKDPAQNSYFRRIMEK
jgi:3-deoxy-manno-octulosonate cytidylyltransferase (CMP-KDO synthetase)